MLHQRYAEFSTELMEQLQKIYSTGISKDEDKVMERERERELERERERESELERDTTLILLFSCAHAVCSDDQV